MSFNPLISLWKRAGLSLWDSDSVPCRNSMQGKPPVRKTTSGGKLGLRKTTPGGAARGAGDSCGSYTHCGFDAHDLRRGQQTRRPIKVSDNRASPARQKPFTATTKSPHEGPAPHAASQVCRGTHPGKTFLFPNRPHLRPCVMTQWNLCKSLRVLWGKDRDEPEGAQGGS